MTTDSPTESLPNLFIAHPQRFIPVKQAAGLVCKGESTIRRWIDEGRIRALKVGGTILVYKPSLVQMIKDVDEL